MLRPAAAGRKHKLNVERSIIARNDAELLRPGLRTPDRSNSRMALDLYRPEVAALRLRPWLSQDDGLAWRVKHSKFAKRYQEWRKQFLAPARRNRKKIREAYVEAWEDRQAGTQAGEKFLATAERIAVRWVESLLEWRKMRLAAGILTPQEKALRDRQV